MRPLATLVAVVASLLPVALAAAIVVNTLPQLSNPCFEWGSSSSTYRTVGPNDPCAATGRGGTSETKLQAVIRLLILSGGTLLAGALAVWGAFARRPTLVVLGAFLMFFESLPWLLTIASVAAFTSGAFLLVARASAPLQRVPKLSARVLGIITALFALAGVRTAVRVEIGERGQVPILLLFTIAFQLFVTIVAWWPYPRLEHFSMLQRKP